MATFEFCRYNLYSPPSVRARMSLLGVRRSLQTRPPPSPPEPKMVVCDQPPGTLPDCCATSTVDDCCNAPLIPCTDEQCLKLMDEYCQVCSDDQACQVPGCNFQCNECCDVPPCPDGLCAATYSQVYLISFCINNRLVLR